MVGSYGKIYQPLCIDERFDYVLFTNDYTEETLGAWQIRSIPVPQEIDKSDNKRLSRYPKTHPETMLSEYSASLYIDANIQIVDKWVYNRVIELAEEKIDYAGIKLLVTGRDCIYRHAYDMCMMHAENDSNAIVQLHALYKEGFPEHFGLNENNIIFRRHTSAMQQVDMLWWEWIVKYSFRDQFSYMYCLWKYNIPIKYFLPEGEDSHNSQHFNFYFHNQDVHVAKQKWAKISKLEKLRNECRNLTKYHRSYYEWEWCLIYKLFLPQEFLTLLGIIAFILNIPLFVLIKFLRYLKKKILR